MKVRAMTARYGNGGADDSSANLNVFQYGRKPRPVCPHHHIEMRVGSSPKTVRYWYCGVPGCDENYKEFKG